MNEKGAHTLLVGLRHTLPQLTFTLHNVLEKRHIQKKDRVDRNKVRDGKRTKGWIAIYTYIIYIIYGSSRRNITVETNPKRESTDRQIVEIV